MGFEKTSGNDQIRAYASHQVGLQCRVTATFPGFVGNQL